MANTNRLSKKGIISVGRWIDILPHIEECNISTLSRRYDISLGYLNQMIAEFERRSWIISYKQGRQKLMKLTSLGKEVANACYIMGRFIKNGEK